MRALIPTLCLSALCPSLVATTAAAQLSGAGTSTLAMVPDLDVDRILLVASGSQKGIRIPGIAGSLQLDPQSLIALPRFDGFGPQLIPLLKKLPKSQFDYQTLDTTQGLRLSDHVRLTMKSGFRQIDDLATCRKRAQRTLDEHRGTDMAPGWDNANLVATPRPMHRPDVSGVAYYEFEVRPAGFIVVATGGHDYPVPHWNYRGRTIGADLQTAAGDRDVHKIWKLDTLCYVAEDSAGRKIANIGGIPDKLVPDGQGGYRFSQWSSWQELKQKYTQTYLPLIANLRQDALEDWAEEAMRRVGHTLPLGGWSSWKSHWAGSSADQRLYTQYNTGTCQSGCGATAWAMLFGWVDVQASRRNNKWRHQTGIYRRYGTRSGLATTIAPRRLDAGVRNIVNQIRSHIRTFCAFGSGATFPWKMGEAKKYLSGRCTAKIRTDYSRVGIRWDSLRDKARDHIVYKVTPVIIGTGWLKHYPLAWGYKSRKKKYGWGFASYTRYQRKFYVNQGWGGSGNGWVDAKTWFAGRIYP